MLGMIITGAWSLDYASSREFVGWVRRQPEFLANVSILLGVERSPFLGEQAQGGIARFREIRAGAARGRPQFQQTTCEHAAAAAGILGWPAFAPLRPVRSQMPLARLGAWPKRWEELEPQQGTLRGVKGRGRVWVIAPVYHAGPGLQARSDGMSRKRPI